MANWKYTLDISKTWNDTYMSIENKGKAIATKIRQTFPNKWFDPGSSAYNEEIDEIAERLSDITGWDGISPTEEFNILMGELYDFGDQNISPWKSNKMAWIETIS